MLNILKSRFHQGYRTNRFPEQVPPLPDRLRGRPVIDHAKCPPGCGLCVDACPTRAIALEGATPAIDLGRCLFCTDCTDTCPTGALTFTGGHALATRRREDLVVRDREVYRLGAALEAKMLALFKRSLRFRVVSAGGCNGCEVDVNVLTTLVWDIGRFGINYVASPRHADGLIICGPVTTSMQLALKKTWDAVPDPKIVVAIGACAISGGPYRDRPEQTNGAAATVPVDLFIPGCPPHPLTILDGFLRLIDRIPAERMAKR